MFVASSRTRQARTRQAGAKPRRGVALVFVLIFVVAMAALAMSSIFMASNSTLLAKSYDKERSLKYASEVALQIGKSRVNSDPTVLQIPVNSMYDTIMLNQVLNGADGKPLPGGVYVNVYAGPTGSTSGQTGRFSSIVAEARDGKRNGFIRRLELAQESFAKFAYWSNDESNGSGTIYFGKNDELWGPVWSNDKISISGTGATFHDKVATAKTISGASGATFDKGYLENQKNISLPSNSTLAYLKTYAASGKFDFSDSTKAGPNSDENDVRERIEFVAYDMPNSPGSVDSIDDNEGFFRRFRAVSADRLRGKWPGTGDVTKVDQCGDWHYVWNTADPKTGYVEFFPASIHNTTWFRDKMANGTWKNGLFSSLTNAKNDADTHKAKGVKEIMAVVTEGKRARCYLAGDPHLVATERAGRAEWSAAEEQMGGSDTTFSPTGNFGSWMKYPVTVDTQVSRVRSATAINMSKEAQYLFPLGRKYNNNAKGVIYEAGNIGLSGTLNGLVTLYAKGAVVFLDDLRYANDPSTGRCHDILGIITDLDAVVADNPQLDPVDMGGGNFQNADDTKDFYLHAVIMALKTSFRVQNYDDDPTDENGCEGDKNGRGCLYLSGGLIQDSRGPVGQLNGHGFAKRYSYDRCAVVNPPPYFPTTGRFTENRFIELDPQGFTPEAYFKTLDPFK